MPVAFGQRKRRGYPPFGFMASSFSVLAAEGTLVAGLNGDGDEHRPRDDASIPVFRKKGRSRLSTPATTSAHQMARPMQATVDPVSHSQMHTGSQTRAVPTKGMGATNAAMRPQNAGWGTSAMAKPTPQRNP